MYAVRGSGGLVFMRFASVSTGPWVAITPDEARQLAAQLKKAAKQAEE